jgi:hypothetical protein
MDSGTSTIFGVATSDRVRRVYNAVISTGREARDMPFVDQPMRHGWTDMNKRLVEGLEMVVAEITEPINMVSAARHLIRGFIGKLLP